ncbi:MAG: amino-acid N-acetyltransferase [Salinisphaeraceae bacterium]|nr:amino-acid N-acetyltransferase [Salinisphaeraceae bacterium]
MSDASFVKLLRDAAPYVHGHHGRCFVIAFGGEAALSPHFAALLYDIALLRSLGVKLVLVHGARPQIESRLEKAGLTPRIENGLRVTDSDALACVKDGVGSLRLDIEALLSSGLAGTPMGGARLDVTSGNLVTAKPVGIRNGVDYEFTGEVRSIDTDAICSALDRGSVVLLSPIGYSPSGETFNLRAEDVAVATAEALQADKLVLMHDGESLQQRLGCDAQLSLDEASQHLARSEHQDTHARDLLSYAVKACNHNVPRVHLVSHADDGALLHELYSRDGAGTVMVSRKPFDCLRPAQVDDIAGIQGLIEPLQNEGALIPRGRERLELELPHFLVMERDGLITACCALFPYPDHDLGELACVAVHPDYRKQGRAEELLEQVERQARAIGLKQLFALTTHSAHWFSEHHFEKASPEALPPARLENYDAERNAQVLVKTL